MFFEYLRALAFALPFKTDGREDKRKFLEKGEIHYSPWVICNNNGFYDSNKIGIRIYSNKKDGLIDLFITFDSLKNYIKERYDLLSKFIEWSQNEINSKREVWSKIKINRNNSIEKILIDAIKISKDRFKDTSYLEDALEIINYDSSNEKTKDAVMQLI